MDGQSGQLPTKVLADQLTLHQPEEADCALTLLPTHPALGSFLRPCKYHTKNILQKSSTNIKTICGSSFLLPLPSLGSSTGGCVGIHVYKAVGTWKGREGHCVLK